MASPQLEKGYTRIANEILEQVSKINLNGTQFRLIMMIWRYTYGFHRKSHEMSISFLAKGINASTSQVEKNLSVLIDRKIIRVIGKGFRGVNILEFNKNHTKWADSPPIRGKSPLPSNQGGELPPNRGEELPSNQGDKKDSIKDNNKDIYVEIINYLNKKAGKRFSPKAAANKKIINGRISEGRTFDDFKYVIDVKCEEWLDNAEMNQYLRPSTLFRPTNFENYLNQKSKHQKQTKQSDPRDKEIAFQQWMQEGNDPNEFDWN